jgi:hypothetical protein
MPAAGQIREEILRQVHGREGSVCPSEVARALADDWRPLMDDVREEAAALADAGALRVTQGEETVDARSARGPIRLRRS